MVFSMKPMICPKCFASFAAEDSAYVCLNAGCPVLGNQLEADGVTSDSTGRPVCAACRGILSTRACPRCGFEISGTATAETTLTFSVIGAEGSGKSNYLSVLIDRIRSEMGKVYNCSLHPSGGDLTIQQYESQYYQPLFVNKKCITSTEQETVQPLVYTLVFGGAGDQKGKTCNITFYDACGANFDSLSILSDYNRNIYNSQGIIFLVDPLQLPGLHLPNAAPARERKPVNPETLLSRTIQLIRGGHMQNVQQKIEIPIAVCLSKMDLFRQQLDPSSSLRYESRHMRGPELDKPDFHACDMEVQSLLESWSGEELVNQIRTHFLHYGFFAFSALGSPPDGSNNVANLTPHRVCDPFLWLLRQNLIIQSN